MVQERIADPLRWKKPRRIFVNSMSDLFHERLTNEQIAAVFGVMAACPQHTFQVLTKRTRRMHEWFVWAGRMTLDDLHVLAYQLVNDVSDARGMVARGTTWPLPNVWVGVSVENQDTADERIPDLLATPAAVRFSSCEPLLGSVDLAVASPNARSLIEDLDLVIAGCESGPGARSCSVEWLRSLRDQCAAAGVPFFLKQARSAWGYSPHPTRPASTIASSIIIGPGPGSKEKPGGVIELPYLDGVQHAAMPSNTST